MIPISLINIRIILINIAFITLPFLVSAASLNPLGNTNTLMDLVGKILKVLIAIGIPVASLAIVYSGFLFVTAEGKAGDVEKAKEALKWTVVGIAVLIGAQGIVSVIKDTVTKL